jgi:acyl-coenzyme A thioesterase PaaI-like protein
VPTFQASTSVTELGDGRFSAELDPAWGSLVGIHGGYQVAIIANATARFRPGRPVRTLTTSFLRPGRPGRVDLEIESVRQGRSLTTLSVQMRQGDSLLNTTRVTMVDRRNGPSWSSPAPTSIRPMSECVPIDPPPMVNHFVHAEAFIDPDFIPFTHGDRALVRGYFRPLDSHPIDAAWLAMAVDWFPPPAFVRIDPPAGGISVDLTTHIHATLPPLAADEWLTASFEVATSIDGVALERGWIAGPLGNVLAETFHTRWVG